MLFKHKILNGIWMMERSSADAYLPLIANYINGKELNFVTKRESSTLMSIHMMDGSSDMLELNRDYHDPVNFIRSAPEGTVLVLNISGAITKHDQNCGPDGMVTVASYLHAAYQTENISGIALKIDSGGGEGGAMRLMQDAILQRNKPVMAYIDDFAASAAYGIASVCDVVTANNELAQIGSIGVYLSFLDYSEKLKKEGINLIEIYAPQSTDKNADINGAISGDKDALERMRQVAGTFCESLISSVENSRKISGRDKWGTGKMFFAKESMELGLIDSIDSFENFLNYLNTS